MKSLGFQLQQVHGADLALKDVEYTTLKNGEPTEGEVGSDNYQYFSFALTEKGVDLTFSLTALSGDPDLFIGIGDDGPF